MSSSLYLLDENQKVIKILPSKYLIELTRFRELGEDGSLPIDRLTTSFIVKDYLDYLAPSYMAVKDLHQDNTFHMYYITQPNLSGEQVTYEGIQLGYHELKYYINRDMRPTNRTAKEMYTQSLEGSGWRIGFVATTITQSTNFFYQSALESVRQISDLFGHDIVFKVQITGKEITDKWIESYDQIGPKTMKRFTHGSNLLSIEQTVERSEIYTALIGRGRGEESVDDSGAATGGFGRKIDFTKVVWSKAQGDPLDKPYGRDYLEIPGATLEYGLLSNTGEKIPRIGIVEFPDTEDPNILIRETYNQLLDASRPLVQYKSTVAKIGEVELGETVTIHRYDLGFHYTTRIHKMEVDYLNPDRTPVTLGDVVIKSRAKREAQISRDVLNLIEEQRNLKQEVNYVVQSADGFNTITYGNTEPTRKRVGDSWVRDDPVHEGYTEWLRWDGTNWILVMSSYESGALQAEIDAILAQADLDRQKTAEDIAQAIVDANTFTEQQTKDLKDQVDASNLIITGAVNDANAKADSAFAKADSAFAEAEIAKNNAFTASQTAQTAINDSLTAINNAQDALTSSESALLAYNRLQIGGSNYYTPGVHQLWKEGGGSFEVTPETVYGFHLTGGTTHTILSILKVITSNGDWAVSFDMKGTGSLKVDICDSGTTNFTATENYQRFGMTTTVTDYNADWNSFVDFETTSLNSNLWIKNIMIEKSNKNGSFRRSDQEIQTQITNLNGQLSSKVSQTTFDTLDQKVTAQGTTLSQTQTALTSKADKSVVDTISQTVSQHTTKIEQNAQAITARLTETQVNNLLGTKNYVNQTTLTATANGLNASITQVSNDLSNLEIGGRNYVQKSLDEIEITNALTRETTYSYPKIKLEPNTEYTFSLEYSASSNTTSVDLFFVSDVGEHRSLNNLPQTNGAFVYKSFTFTTGSNPNQSGNPRIDNNGNTGGTSVVRARKVKIEKGNKATDWTPAPEDMATVEQFTTIDATVKGLQVTVGNKAEKSELTVLAGQISSKVESSTYTSKMTQLDSAISSRVTSTTYNSKMTQLDSAIQSKVDSTTYSSKMTQLDNAINLRVVQKDVTDAILADKTIKDTRGANELPSWYFANYPKQTVEEFKQRTTMGVPGSATYGQLTTKVIWNSTSGGVITQIFSSSDGVFQRQGNSAATAWGAWDKIAETGKLVSQINLSTEGILIQGKRIQLDGDVTMTTAFVNDLNAKTLSAITANITTIRSQVLQANVVTSTHLQTSTATIEKLFATDAMVTTLTAKAAFINSIKTIDLSASRITTGTLNAASVSIINLNASNITTGTISGANSSWGLNTGMMDFTNPSTGDQLRFTQGQIEFQNGAQGRYLKYNAEGLVLEPFASNYGTSLNTMLRLQGGGTGSYQYIQFQEGGSATNYTQRLEAVGGNIRLLVQNELQVLKYGTLTPANVTANGYTTYHSTGNILYMTADRIETPRYGNRNIMISPQGTGIVQIANRDGAYYNIRASTFLNSSSRRLKTNIVDYKDSAIEHLNDLLVVEYNLKKDLEDGVDNRQIGFIAEDSPYIASKDMESIDSYKLTALTVKSVQELDQKVVSLENIAKANTALASQALSETAQLRLKIEELENKIKKLESVA